MHIRIDLVFWCAKNVCGHMNSNLYNLQARKWLRRCEITIFQHKTIKKSPFNFPLYTIIYFLGICDRFTALQVVNLGLVPGRVGVLVKWNCPESIGMVEQNLNLKFLLQIHMGYIPNPSAVYMKWSHMYCSWFVGRWRR